MYPLSGFRQEMKVGETGNYIAFSMYYISSFLKIYSGCSGRSPTAIPWPRFYFLGKVKIKIFRGEMAPKKP